MSFYKAVCFVPLIFLFSGCFSGHSDSPEIEKSKEAESYFVAGDIDSAIACWEDILSITRDDKVYEKIVMAHVIKNDFESAEYWTKEGLTYFPGNVNLIFNFAIVKFQKEEFECAIESLDRVLEINSFYPNAHFLKGLIYEQTGDKEAAIREFVNEVNINPGSKGAWQKLRRL